MPAFFRNYWIIALTFGATLGSFAQLDHKVTTGKVHYDQGNFEQAIAAFDLALVDQSQLKAKNIGKAFYFRGKSKMQLISQAAQAKDQAKLTGYKHYFVESSQDLRQARKSEDYANDAERDLGFARQSLLQLGLNALTNVGNGSLNAENRIIHTNDAMAFLKEASLVKEDYLVFDLLGQAMLLTEDSAMALKHFSKAIALMNLNTPLQPDIYFAYAYYRKALLERYHLRNNDAALQTISEGLDYLKDRKFEVSNLDSPDDRQRLMLAHGDARADLSSFELDILLNSPERRMEALKKFELATDQEPTNYIKHVAFAQLLEKVDLDKATTIYKRAITIDPSQHIAHFNLGALYVNQGVEWYKKANEATDLTLTAAHQSEGDDKFRLAKPHLEKAQEISPCDQTTLGALMQITLNLGLDVDYAKYKSLRENCN